MIFYLQLLAAHILDALIGDPRWFPHPVRGIGLLCSKGEIITRSMTANPYLAGFLTVIIVLVGTGSILSLILYVASLLPSIFEGIVGIFLFYTTIAARDLLRHSNEVYMQLKDSVAVDNARIAVAQIVGRDTSTLSREGVSRAAIETVAENMVDGITAPLFFGLLASCFAVLTNVSPLSCAVLGAFLYKAVNTMDSMIAYKNEKYLKFGRVAAKLDDAVNFIPARLSGVCLIIAAIFLKLDYKNATRVFLKDRLNHSSPNAGHTEAVTAGALGIRLGGPSSYFNEVVEKPYIGDGIVEPEPEDIKRTNRLIVVGAMIFFVCLVGLRLVLFR